MTHIRAASSQCPKRQIAVWIQAGVAGAQVLLLAVTGLADLDRVGPSLIAILLLGIYALSGTLAGLFLAWTPPSLHPQPKKVAP